MPMTEQETVMDRSDFWRIMDKARRKAGGDGETTGELVGEVLSRRSAGDIRAFAGHLNECLGRSYTRTLAEACALMTSGGEYLSDDLFEYFRAWLITRGEKVFEAALADPDTLATINVDDPVEECTAETLLSAPAEALEDAGEEGHTDLVDLDISRGEPAGEWTGPTEKILPRLWAKYGQRLES
jgi:hypothetical protein